MLPETIPKNSRTDILNQEILYTDEILDFSKSFDCTITKCIEKVGEYSLETCIKMILEENPGILFKTIQYSKMYEKVYFYTNQEISTTTWDKRNKIYTRTLKDDNAIVLELYTTLISDYQKYTDCISLYDIKQLLTGLDCQYTQNLFCLDQIIIYSKFLVTINKGKINVFSMYAPSSCFKNFELSIDYINNDYKCSNHNKSIIKILVGKEDILLKKLFIKIDDCPNWSKKNLYLIRKKQLEKEEKKQKIRKLLYPWKKD